MIGGLFRRGPAFEAFLSPARARAAIWRTALGALLAAALIFGASVGVGLALAVLSPADLDVLAFLDRPAGVAATLGSFAIWWIALAIVLRLLHRRRLRSLFGAGSGLRPFLAGFAAAMAFNLVGLALGWAIAGAPELSVRPLGLWLVWAVLALPLVLLQTGAEEAVFRGYLLQQLAARFRSPWVWAAIPSILFGLLHWNPAAPGGVLPIMLVTGVIGFVLAALTAHTGGVAAAWGVHFGVNVFALLFVAAPDYLSGLALATWARGEEAALVWLDLALVLLFALCVALWIRRSQRGGSAPP